MNKKESINLSIEEVEPKRYLKALDIEKLNKSEDRTINPIFGVYHIRALVCGSSGSGKTTFILNYILQNLDEYKLILYLAPTETLESGFLKTVKTIQSLKNKLVFLDIRNDKLPTIQELQQLNQIQTNKKGHRIALILDDFINVLTSKDDIKQLNAYLTQSSRASCDLFLLVQTYNKITPSIATNINTLILFPKYMSRDSFNACIRRSFTGEYNKKIGDEIYNTLRHTNPHKPFIFINDQPADKSIIFNNYYLNFEDSNMIKLSSSSSSSEE
jgi:GTPase SAR1 family protein